MKKIVCLFVCLFVGSANAAIISEEFSVTTGSTDISYFDFSVTSAGTFTLDAFGFSTLGNGYNIDTVLQLFQTSLNIGNHLGGDDDSGIGADAQLTSFLNIGNYILAVGDYFFSAADAVAGVGGSVEAPGGLIRAQVSSADGVAVRTSAVPGPSIIALFGLGLVGLGFARRRQA
ncbi:MAG: hypothetical protein ACI9UT_002249 [Flavobacteriales bacterium]|jgi:hypothetical protein